MSILTDDTAPLFQTTNKSDIMSQIQKQEEKVARDPKDQQSLVDRLREKINQTKVVEWGSLDVTLFDTAQLLNALCSIFLVLEFIIHTYSTELLKNSILQYLEMGVLVYLTADWILFFYTSETRILYPFEFQSFVSYVTIIPSILLLTGTLEFSIRTDNVVAT